MSCLYEIGPACLSSRIGILAIDVSLHVAVVPCGLAGIILIVVFHRAATLSMSVDCSL